MTRRAQDDAERIMKRILDNKFDFNDFLSQYQAMNNMGGTKMMKLIPGFTQVWGGVGSSGRPYPIQQRDAAIGVTARHAVG